MNSISRWAVRWTVPILAAALAAGCVGEDPDDLEDGPIEAVSQAFNACASPVSYADSATVNNPECSATYTPSAGHPLDDCHNAASPPLPSVLRNYVAPLNPTDRNPDGNSGAIAFPKGPWDTTKPFLLPTFRTSNDGRLTLLEGGAFGLFLPENAGYDLKPLPDATRRAVGASSYGFHPYHFFNPFDTRLTVAVNADNQIVNMPEGGHQNLCDDSGSGFFKGVSPQISFARNPHPCTAKFRDDGQNPRLDGDCYDVTLQTNATLCTDPTMSVWSCGPTQANAGFCSTSGFAANSPLCPSVRWEIRSTDLTVFVPRARRTDAGSFPFFANPSLPDDQYSDDNKPVWVYPRQATSTLPAYDGVGTAATSYNPHRMSWDHNYAEARSCYAASGYPTHAANAPKWCEFLWIQRRTPDTGFLVDSDGDGNDNPVSWDGRSYGGLNLFEPATTGDGRLMILNMMQAGLVYSYIPPASGNACDASKWTKFKPISRIPRDTALQDRYEIARAQMLRDASGAVKTDALSRANARLFRDTRGQAIPAGTPIPGAYLWIDRQGRTAVFSHAPLIRAGYHAKSATGYCVNPADETGNCGNIPLTFSTNPANDLVLNPDRTAGKGQSILGAWTQGKIVHLDDALNLSDWGGRGHWFSDRYTYQMSLYNECDAQGHPVMTAVRPKPNTTVFSLENQLNHFDPLNPALPFDVVWRAEGSGGVSAEIAFDDYVRNNALIVAHMNAAIDIRCGNTAGADYGCSTPTGTLRFSNGRILDGFVPAAGASWAGAVDPGWNSHDAFAVDPTLQNASTASTAYDATAVAPPSSLRLRGGARVEPINAGGVLGRGVYLDGQNDIIDAAYPYQAGRTEWWLGVWLDSRDLATLRTVFFFPDESSIAIKGDRLVAHDGPRQQNGFAGVEQVVTLPAGLIAEGRFFHLGVKLTTESDKRVIRFAINGTPLPQPLTYTHLKGTRVIHDPPDPDILEKYDIPLGFQLMQPGAANGYTWFALAGCTTDWNPPFKGWVDEFKVYALGPNELSNTSGFYDEIACNQALGTMVDLSAQVNEGFDKYLGILRNKLALYGYTYPGSGVVGKPVRAGFCEQLDLVPDGTQAELPAQHDNVALCVHRVHKNHSNLTRCMREASLGIVPVLAQDPLPGAFASDKFCLGCHHADAQLDGLKLTALQAGSGPSREDARRRPMLWPAAVSGDQYSDPFASMVRLAGWNLCDPGTASCTALDDTVAVPNHKWFFP